VACKTEHGTALGPSRSKLYTIGPTGTHPNLELYFMPVMCQQCEDPPCVKVCPTGACAKSDDDGVIRIDGERCLGCRTCERSCPYEALVFNKELHIMDKCDICQELREKGETPVCVKNCSGQAIHYGDLNDPASDVAQLAAQVGKEQLHSLEDQGNKPAGKFILRRAAWKAALPHKFQASTGGPVHE
jgi:Fe-S-cluster-containing dehydrogenase component